MYLCLKLDFFNEKNACLCSGGFMLLLSICAFEIFLAPKSRVK